MRVVSARQTPRFLSPRSLAVLASAVLLVLPRVQAENELAGKDTELATKESSKATSDKADTAEPPRSGNGSKKETHDDDAAPDSVPSLEDRAEALKALRQANPRSFSPSDDLNWLYDRVDLTAAKVPPLLPTKLAALREIEHICFAKSDITDAGLLSLKKLPGLRSLDLSNTRITDAGLAHVAMLPKIEILRLSHTPITDEGLAALAELKDLEELDLDGTAIDGAGLRHLARLPKLAVLNVSGSKFGDLGLHHLRNVRSLRSLNLTGTSITDSGVAELRGLTKLAGLYLGDTRVGDAGIQAISGLPEIMELTLSNSRIGDVSAVVIGHWAEIRVLNLAGTAVTDRGMRSLARINKLLRLNLADTRITDLALPVVRRFDNLQALNLANTAVSRAGLIQLESLPSLRSIDVSGTSVTSFDLFHTLPKTVSSVRKVLAALDEKTELDFLNQPLSDVVEYLRQRHDVEIQFSRRGIKDAAVFDKPITLQLKGVTLREALEAILKPLDLTVAVRHEVLLIAASPLPEKVSDIPAVPSGERLSAKLAEALMQPTDVDFAEQPLTDVVQYLSRKHRIEIELDPESLSNAGIGSDAPVTRGVKGITLKSGLELMLDDLDLTCVADGEKLIIRAQKTH